jgi:hypothetical protein
MKLDEDPLQVNMNTVELEGKKVLVWPSQAESTEDDQVKKSRSWPMEEEREKQAAISSKSYLQHTDG